MNATQKPFFEIGRVGKSHGLKGEVKVDFILDDVELIEELTLVYLQSPKGELVPKRIINVRVTNSSNSISFFVHFDKIDDRTKAEFIRDYSIVIEHSDANHWIEYSEEEGLDGFSVRDLELGEIGLVTDTLETAAHLIIVVNHENSDLLIPFVDEYVISIDEDKEFIQCQNLKQLTEVDDED